MTATILETEVDTSDLDLLGDPYRHLRCARCYPDPLDFGKTFEAKCGRRAMSRGLPMQFTPPPDACPECVPLQGKPCRRCYP